MILGVDICVEQIIHRSWNDTIRSHIMKYDEVKGIENQATLETKFGALVSWFARATSLTFSGSSSPFFCHHQLDGSPPRDPNLG